MATDFIPIPDWFSWDNQGAGSAVADLNGDGRPELIVFQIDSPAGQNQGYYRVGWSLDEAGNVTGGWGPWIAVPDWFLWENQGADIAVADLNGDGRPELIVFQIDSPVGQNQGYYRVGWSLDEAGNVTGGWSSWIAVPDWFSWENQGAGIAVADLDNNGRPELIVFQVDSPAGLNVGYYRIGWNLGVDGSVSGGWSAWMRVDWFSWENHGVGIAAADLDGNGRPELIVFQIDNPLDINQGLYQIGWNLDTEGRITGGWSPWVPVPDWFSQENQGAGIALADLDGDGRPELVVVLVDHPPAGNRAFHRVLDLEIDLDHAADLGIWRLLPEDSQILGVHAALLHTDKVCFFAGSSNNPDNLGQEFRGVVWDFRDHSLTRANVPADVFCSGHAFLADGRLLVAGGTQQYDPFFGLRDALTFDAAAEQWTFVPSMMQGRWYPTLVTLGDGRVLAISGLGQDGLLDLVPEIFSAATGWTALPDLTTWSAVPEDSTRRVPLYAQMFLLRDGRLFYSGGQYGGNEGLNPCLLDLVARSITEVPGLVGHEEQSHRNQAASVLLPPAQDQRVMLIGGGAADPAAHETHETTEAIDNVNIADLAAGQPQYRATASLQWARMHHNAILLPDRTLLVAGGSRMDESRVAATLVAEIYDPSGETWTLAAAARVPRLYHSTVVLLPDGTVITAGSNPTRGDEELRLELFHPPYLFKGERPVIDGVAEVVTYGATIDIQCQNAADIQWVSLVRPTSTTHCLNTDQRLVDVPFRLGSGDALSATIPDEPNVAPPGWYMLFLTNRAGIPSVARWVRLEGS